MKNRGCAFAEAAAVAGPVSFSLPPIPYWPQVLGRYLPISALESTGLRT